MDVTGTLKVKFDALQVSEKFKKREFVLTLDAGSSYPQQVTFQLTQDKVSLIDSLNQGEEIKVHFNLRGREWVNKEGETKYFNTLEAWRIEKAAPGQQNSVAQNTTAAAKENTPPPVFNSSVADDDLPF